MFASSLVPHPFHVASSSARASAATATITPTAPTGVIDGDTLIFCACSVAEADTITLPGSITPLIDDGTTAQRIVVGVTTYTTGMSLQFTKTGTGGLWRVGVYAVRGPVDHTKIEVGWKRDADGGIVTNNTVTKRAPHTLLCAGIFQEAANPTINSLLPPAEAFTGNSPALYLAHSAVGSAGFFGDAAHIDAARAAGDGWSSSSSNPCVTWVLALPPQ